VIGGKVKNEHDASVLSPILYLCVFSDGGRRPVGYSFRKEVFFIFRNVSRESVNAPLNHFLRIYLRISIEFVKYVESRPL